MADIYDMTADELEQLAARKRAAAYYPAPSVPEPPSGDPRARIAPRKPGVARKPWERDVEVDGRRFRVDMRPMKSRECLRRLASIRDAGKADRKMRPMLDLFDFIFEPVSDQIMAAVEDEVGYEDADAYYDLCGRIFEELQGKN